MIPPLLLEKSQAKGSDEEYQAYVRTFPSVLSLRFSEFPYGEGRCEYSHEREVAAGSGIGIKPPYSGVPLTSLEHKMVHQHGESYFNPKEWWIEQRNTMLQNWVNNVKPISIEDYDEQKEIFITLGSPQHIRAFELTASRQTTKEPCLFPT